jgi:membrane-associated phospholipid phosphatase
MWTTQERLRFHVLAGMTGIDVGLYAAGAMRMRWDDLVVPLVSAAVVLAGAATFRRQGRRALLAATLIAVGQVTLFAVLAAIMNYLLLSDRPLIDAELARLDAALGVHWPSLFAALKGGTFGQLLTVAYESNGIQLAGVILLLGFTGRTLELDRYLLAFFLATLGALAFWAVLPSLGSAAHVLSTGIMQDWSGATVSPAVARALLDLKSGALVEMELENLKGLIAFPSLHTVMALLVVYSVREIKIVFWPVLAWNALMLVSIPVDGGHHVVDVPAGVLLMVVSVLAARRIVVFAEQRASRSVLVAA